MFLAFTEPTICRLMIENNVHFMQNQSSLGNLSIGEKALVTSEKKFHHVILLTSGLVLTAQSGLLPCKLLLFCMQILQTI